MGRRDWRFSGGTGIGELGLGEIGLGSPMVRLIPTRVSDDCCDFERKSSPSTRPKTLTNKQDQPVSRNYELSICNLYKTAVDLASL